MELFDITDPLAAFKMGIQERLRMVMDPELHINIIDLGLVYGIAVTEAQKQIEITMTLSSPYCPIGAAIFQSVENCLHEYYPEFAIRVQLTWQPEWSYERISEEGLRLLRA